MDRESALSLLRIGVGQDDAVFRDDQWEIIDALVDRKENVLLVQRTGWGKSAVYFISAKMMRQQGFGVTIIVSPLIGLMRNQVLAGRRMGLRIGALHSGTNDRFEHFRSLMLLDRIDVLLVAPERFANPQFLDHLLPLIVERTGLLVIDEAHCISDWGHDFRPDYKRLSNIVRRLPPNSALLATTATANDRVVHDICEQLGDVRVSRGSLNRENLALQAMRTMSVAERLAWLARIVPTLPGKGIVYTLTTRDADQVAGWLVGQGIDAHAYHASITAEGHPSADEARKHLENAFLGDNLDVLVATSALGMGYDNPLVRFVIHYQSPDSIISYYQQVGRAGRGEMSAFGVLLSGPEDAEINSYFRISSLPTSAEIREILAALDRMESASLPQLVATINAQQSRVEHVLKYLSVETPAPVMRLGPRWYRTPVPWNAADHTRRDALIAAREAEWQDMQRYRRSEGCRMRFLLRSLNDVGAPERCGRCDNCIGESLMPTAIDAGLLSQAEAFLMRSGTQVVTPRLRIPCGAFSIYSFPTSIPSSLRAEEGRALSHWRDQGWGSLVADGKLSGHFDDSLVDAAVDLVWNRWRPTPKPTWVTCIPSDRHPRLVADFTQRVADRLSIPFRPVVFKPGDNDEQKLQANSFHQCRNLDGVFQIREQPDSGPVFLIDDTVDSRWTFTVVAMLLRRAGSGPVFPLALASTTTSGDT